MKTPIYAAPAVKGLSGRKLFLFIEFETKHLVEHKCEEGNLSLSVRGPTLDV